MIRLGVTVMVEKQTTLKKQRVSLRFVYVGNVNSVTRHLMILFEWTNQSERLEAETTQVDKEPVKCCVPKLLFFDGVQHQKRCQNPPEMLCPRY